MVGLNSYWSSLVLALLSSSSLPLASAAPTASTGTTYHLFAFGDSYTTTGFDVNGTQPSVSGNPLGNPDVGKGTVAGGANYIGWLATKYRPSNNPLLAYDFGKSGATVSPAVVPMSGNVNHTFENQVCGEFLPKYGAQRNKLWTSDSAIFSVFIGINDIGRSIPQHGDQRDQNTTLPALMRAYFDTCDTLYAAGARRFMFVGIPPTDRSPMVRDYGHNKTVQWADWVREYNIHLAGAIGNFVKKYEAKGDADKVYAVTYDYGRYLGGVLDDPTKYGFTNATCTDRAGQKCVWYNGYHVSSKLDDLLAARMAPAMKSLGWDGSAPKGGYFY